MVRTVGDQSEANVYIRFSLLLSFFIKRKKGNYGALKRSSDHNVGT